MRIETEVKGKGNRHAIERQGGACADAKKKLPARRSTRKVRRTQAIAEGSERFGIVRERKVIAYLQLELTGGYTNLDRDATALATKQLLAQPDTRGAMQALNAERELAVVRHRQVTRRGDGDGW